MREHEPIKSALNDSTSVPSKSSIPPMPPLAGWSENTNPSSLPSLIPRASSFPLHLSLLNPSEISSQCYKSWPFSSAKGKSVVQSRSEFCPKSPILSSEWKLGLSSIEYRVINKDQRIPQFRCHCSTRTRRRHLWAYQLLKRMFLKSQQRLLGQNLGKKLFAQHFMVAKSSIRTSQGGSCHQLRHSTTCFWASEFEQDIHTSTVEYMSSTLDSAIGFNQNIGDWDMSNVVSTRTQWMFRINYTVFKQKISQWNILSKVTSIRNIFTSAPVFDQNLCSSWGPQTNSEITHTTRMF